MSRTYFRLALGLAAGRGRRAAPLTREEILRSLPAKRAVAARSGLTGMEARLREQIRWALPVRGAEAETDAAGTPAPPEPPDGEPR